MWSSPPGRTGVRPKRDATLDGRGAEELADGGLERGRVVGESLVIGELAVLAEVAEDAVADCAGELVDVAVDDLPVSITFGPQRGVRDVLALVELERTLR